MVNEPVVPVPPPPEEEHEVLLTDDQLTVAVVPFAIDDGVANNVTVGVVTIWAVLFGEIGGPPPTVDTDPTPPPHEARPETANNVARIILGRNLEPTALIFDMLVSLQYSLNLNPI